MTDVQMVPDWLEERRVDDANFASAYDGQGGERRAWMKKLIAQQYAMDAPSAQTRATSRAAWRSGFTSVKGASAPDFAVVVLGAGVQSGPQAVAAALPAVVSGARTVLALRLGEGGADADAVLAGMELCGMENVFAVSVDEACCVIAHLNASGRGAVVVLGDRDERVAVCGAAQGEARCAQVLTLPQATRLGVWYSEDAPEWDTETILWAHPGAQVDVWNAPQAQAGCDAHTGTREEFEAAGYDAVYVPESLFADVAELADRAFGPGQEGVWAWPGVTCDFFSVSGLALGGISA
jgi:hypothetical protein